MLNKEIAEAIHSALSELIDENNVLLVREISRDDTYKTPFLVFGSRGEAVSVNIKQNRYYKSFQYMYILLKTDEFVKLINHKLGFDIIESLNPKWSDGGNTISINHSLNLNYIKSDSKIWNHLIDKIKSNLNNDGTEIVYRTVKI